MLDIALGQVDALHKVLAELQGTEMGSKKGGKQKEKQREPREDIYVTGQQHDALLPPEMPTNWVSDYWVS